MERVTDPDPLLEIAARLSDAVFDWWSETPPPIVYRARTVPSGRSVAFTRARQLRLVGAGQLRNAAALNVHLVLHAGFTVPEAWLL